MSLKVTVLSAGAGAAQSRGLGPWLARTAPARARGRVTVAIVPDATMSALNKRFRRVDEPTDVLSFPPVRNSAGSRLDLGELDLGEIVIARGVARRQARSLGHSTGVELRILALHGLLHLLGYDHEVDNGRMARVEGRLRRRAGLPEGLIARSS
ncbi:MAG TPA: rRNA maturation RNase YbeY [Vicinamibacterales bacterium]|nr:rRNA maturation RNase YbeY [Vicinamibacterales bacterium]